MHPEEQQLYEIILIAAIILAIITGYFIYSVIRQKNHVLKWQQNRIRAEIETLENERERIASDLHDELGPMLSAVKLQVNHLEPVDENEKKLLEKSSKHIDEIVKRFREISYDLLPNTLVRKGLLKAAEEFFGKMNDAHDLKIEFNYPTELAIPKEKEINIYRMLQEITHNTIKHAKAANLKINLHKTGTQLILHTKDDGCGFSYETKLNESSGLGLLNLQSRAEVLNGQMSINSQPGNGTEFYITIPV